MTTTTDTPTTYAPTERAWCDGTVQNGCGTPANYLLAWKDGHGPATQPVCLPCGMAAMDEMADDPTVTTYALHPLPVDEAPCTDTASCPTCQGTGVADRPGWHAPQGCQECGGCGEIPACLPTDTIPEGWME